MSTSEIKKDIYSIINKLYSNAGFMDKYGTDLWIVVMICIIFFLTIFYMVFYNNLEVLRSNWNERRCDPSVLLFAGFINKPSNLTTLEYTAQNFAQCTNGILKNISAGIFQPFYLLLNTIIIIYNSIIDALKYIRQLLDYLRKQFIELTNYITDSTSKLIIPFITIMITARDTTAKMNGVLTAALYTLFGSYLTMQSLFMSIIDFIILILIIIAAMYIALHLIAVVIPFCFGCWAFSPAALVLMIFIAILIPIIYFKIMMDRILSMSTPGTPDIPTCFAENTVIELANGLQKNIQEIEVGDLLKDNITVTSILKLSGHDQYFYKLDDVIVTGEHRVFHPVLKWIKVKEHPAAIYLPERKDKYVYCLNTDKKLFIINKTIFSDWDDIDTEVVEDLNNNCVARGYLPENFYNADIHTYLDSGLHPASLIKLKTGLVIAIKDVQVNDILSTGERVRGVVKINANDLYICENDFEDENQLKHHLCSTRNVHINDRSLGVINLLDLKTITVDKKTTEPYFYHLLTDTAYFTVNEIRIHDYNYGIDAYLRINHQPSNVKI